MTPGQVVFVVSGDSYVRSSLETVLRAQGLHAALFETGAGYMACPKPDVPGCLILDVALPDMSGLDLQQQLTHACPPVIFVTRHADVAFSVRAIKAGALDFLAFPFEPQLLLRAVRSAFDLCASTRVRRDKVQEMCDRLEKLTPREREVLQSVVGGMLNKQVAAWLGISGITVQIHRRRVMRKMGATSFAELVRMAEILGVPPVVPELDASRRGAIRMAERACELR